MNATECNAFESDVSWPKLAPLPAERVLSGSPATATVFMNESAEYQLGLWKVTPGSFTTDHGGYIEFIHVVEGSGRLVSDAGSVTELRAGTTTLMPSGWKGRWEVDTTLTKVFTIISISGA